MLFLLMHLYRAIFALQRPTPFLTLFMVFQSSQLSWFPGGICADGSTQKFMLALSYFQAFSQA